MKEFGKLESSEKTIATLGDRLWPQTAKQDGDGISKQFLCSIWKKRNERPHVGGVSIRSRNGAPSPKGCVVNGAPSRHSRDGRVYGHTTTAMHKLSTPPPLWSVKARLAPGPCIVGRRGCMTYDPKDYYGHAW